MRPGERRRPIVMRMIRQITGAVLAVALATPATLAAQDAALERIRQGEARQQAIRAQTAAVAAELESLIGEFERNGLGGGEDVRVLRAMRDVLGNLSQEQMDRIVALLQQARGTGDAGGARRHVLEAYAAQKGILAQLNQLLNEYRRQQVMYDLAMRFGELAERQAANLKAAVQLARSAGGKPADRLSDSQHASLAVQGTEQSALRDETQQLMEQLRKLLESADGPVRQRVEEAMQSARQAGLETALRSAAEDLQAGNLFRAALNERTARDQLRELARMLERPKDTVGQLRESIQQLDQQLAQQRQVAQEAERLRQDWDKEAALETESKQADIVDQAEQVRRDLENVAPEVADQIRSAQEQMQEARLALNEGRRDQVVQRTQDAQKALAEAMESAREQLAEAQRDQPLPADAGQALAQMQEQVRDLAQRQEQLRRRSQMLGSDALKAEAARQQDLRRQARELQGQATRRSEAAAEAMREAAEQMDRAASVMASASGNPAEPQQQAIDALDRAAQALEQQAAQIQQQQEELASLEASRQQVAELIEAQMGLETRTAQAEQADEEMVRQQGELAEQAEAAQEQMPAAAEQAKAEMAEAQSQMQQAGRQLQENQPSAAQAAQQGAVAALQQAKRQLDEQIQQRQQALGQSDPAGDARRLEEIARELEAAQQQIGEAMAGLSRQGEQAGQPGQSAQALAEVAEDVTRAAAGDEGALPDPAEQAMNEAAESLSQAAQNARAGNASSAQQQAQSAQDQIGQALAAITLARAGMQPQGAPVPMPSQSARQMPSHQVDEMNAVGGDGNRDTIEGAGENQVAAQADISGQAFIGLPERDREAIQQSQRENYPEEYAPLVEQYLRNLAAQEKR